MRSLPASRPASTTALREAASETRAAERRPDVETLHLAHPRFERPEPDASRRLVPVECEQEAAARRRVVSGQLRELALEVLEAEVDAERVCVLLEEGAYGGQAFGAVPVDDVHALTVERPSPTNTVPVTQRLTPKYQRLCFSHEPRVPAASAQTESEQKAIATKSNPSPRI
jgi:hypothetical protein